MGRVIFVVAETARDSKIFSRNFCLVQLMCGKDSSLRAENQAARKFAVKLVNPAAASRVSSVFVNPGNVAKVWLFN